MSIFFFFPVHDLPYIPQHETRGVLIYVLVMSCLIVFSSLFFSLFLGLAFDQGTHGIQIGTEFLFWTHKVMALRVPGLGLQIPDVLYIEIETFTSHPSRAGYGYTQL